MAKNPKNARRPDARQQAAQRRPLTSMTAAERNAQRRSQRKASSRSGTYGWIAAGGVLVVAAVLVIVYATGGSPNSKTATGDAAGRNPALATASVVGPLTSIPTRVFDAVGAAGMAVTLTPTAHQPALKEGALPRFVYIGGEYCPFCAMDRWSMVAALDRFGTFTGLKQIVSSPTDNAYKSIPTLSFFRSSYTSKYVAFTPYEEADIASQPLVTPPASAEKLYTTYDDSGSGTGTAFNGGSGGIPFVDIANRFVSSGAPGAFAPVANALQGNALTHTQIADAIKDPSSPVGNAMAAKLLVGQANYFSAAICSVDGNKPASVCSSKGVMAAASLLKSAKKVG